MDTLSKTIYTFNVVHIKIPPQFFTELERSILNFIWKKKTTSKTRIAKTILYNKETSRGIAITDFKPYCRAVVIKFSKNWHKNKQIDQWSQIKDPDVNLYTQGHPILDKEAKNKQW